MPIQRKKSESEISQGDENSDYLNLSSRECEVLDQLSRGACNQNLACSLGVTLRVRKNITSRSPVIASHSLAKQSPTT